ncbi:Inactive glucose-6-phosphate 1-dehydrogenase 4 [Cardamine amara subsp. amara]|uniref:Glucose-6-phosphate 1-dehydrogenase n=1 Tax=Cardamine amara subsp. amara TaxID=228776 RepID=A0ABD1C7N1_CARAN
MSLANCLLPFSQSGTTPSSSTCSCHLAASFSNFPVSSRDLSASRNESLVLNGGGSNLCRKFCGLKLWILKSLNLKQGSHRKHQPVNELKTRSEHTFLSDERGFTEETKAADLRPEENILGIDLSDGYHKVGDLPPLSKQVLEGISDVQRGASLCIAVVGATGELARMKIFPALFALYYSGYLPEDVAIFGFSRKNLTDEDLRSIIASTLTCRVDHQENCGDKIAVFLSRTYYINGGYNNNREGMSRLAERMKQIEGESKANRIFYLSVPQEALVDVACTIGDKAQAPRGWTRIIVEKPFGFNSHSSHLLTKSILSKFEERQIYRIDHMLGRNLIENLTVLRFSNLVFEPVWNRTYIRNVQVIVSESIAQTEKYSDGYGIIRDIVHSHILQTIALLAMEPPISLDGEDIRNEKVKVLRSIRKLDPRDVILGQYKSSSQEKNGVVLNGVDPTYCAAALYIDNARWDGVPFLVRVGTGLIKHRVEIRVQFRHVPGNLYRENIGINIDLGTNELILRGEPDEAILVKVNNKVPGLGLQLDASELNLLYKDRYSTHEVPDSYEHLIHDVIDGDNHLFMRSDEVAAAWNILSPVLEEIDKHHTAPELYEFGGRGPVGAYYLWAKHGVPWADD